MKLNIALLPGDGIGPEIMEQGMKAVQAVCNKFGHELSYKHALVGACAIDATGNPYPDETHVESEISTRAALRLLSGYCRRCSETFRRPPGVRACYIYD